MNIKKAIEKLDELHKGQKDMAEMTFPELRCILEAMDEPEDGTKKSHSHQFIMDEIKTIHTLIGIIEDKCGCKVKWKEEIECRVGVIETQLFEQKKAYWHNQGIPNVGLRVPEPSSQSGHTGACQEGCQCTIARMREPSSQSVEWDNRKTITISRAVASHWYYVVAKNPAIKICSDERDMVDEVGKALNGEGNK